MAHAPPPALRLRQGAHAAARGRRRRACSGPARRSPLPALAEVRACSTSTPSSARPATHLATRIAAAYAGGETSAAVGGRRGRERGRPLAPDAGHAGGRGPARIGRRRADHPHDQRAADAGAREDGASDIHIEPYERARVVRFRIDGMLRDVVQPEPRAARGADLAHQDHGRARHRREAPAAGRPHHAAHRRPRGRRARLDAADRRTASAWCCACSTRTRASSTLEDLGMSGDALVAASTA